MPVNFEGNVSVFQKQQFDEAMLYLTRAEGMADIAYALSSQNVSIKFVYDGRDAYSPSTNMIQTKRSCRSRAGQMDRLEHLRRAATAVVEVEVVSMVALAELARERKWAEQTEGIPLAEGTLAGFMRFRFT